MSMTLAEALGQVELEPGRVYRCQVRGHWVELRVHGAAAVEPSARYDDSDVMLDPWVDFPWPSGGVLIRPKLGSMPLPDPPDIPRDEDPA